MPLKIIYGQNASGKTSFFNKKISNEKVIGFTSKDVWDKEKSKFYKNLNMAFEFKTREMVNLNERYDNLINEIISLCEGALKLKDGSIQKLIEKAANNEETDFNYKNFFKFTLQDSIGGKTFSLSRLLFFDELLSYDYDENISENEKIEIIRYLIIMKINAKISSWQKAFSSVYNFEKMHIENATLDQKLMNTSFYKLCENTTLPAFEKKSIYEIVNSDYSSSNYSWDLKNALLSEIISISENADFSYLHNKANDVINKFEELHKISNRIIGFNGEKIKKETENFKLFFINLITDSSLADYFNISQIGENIILEPIEKKRELSTGQKTMIFIFEKTAVALASGSKIIFDDILETLDDANKEYVIEEMMKINNKIDITILSHDSFVNTVKSFENVETFYMTKESPTPVKGNKMHHTHAMNFMTAKLSKNDPKHNAQQILRISYRTFGRSVASFQKFFNSNKRFINQEAHGVKIYEFISDYVLHYRKYTTKKNAATIFAEERNWISARNPKDSLEFCEFMIEQIEKITKSTKSDYYGVSFHSLLELWTNVGNRLTLEKAGKKDEITRSVQNEIHYLDLTKKD